MSEEIKLSDAMQEAIVAAKAAVEDFRQSPCLDTAKRAEEALALCRDQALFDSMTRRP